MAFENRKYMIINVNDVDKIDFTEVMQTSIEHMRKSLDGSKTIVKWEGDGVPNSVANLVTKDGPYTQDEMLQILYTPEWFDFSIISV